MKFDKKTILSSILTLFILVLITFIVKVGIDEWNELKQEALQTYGDERESLEAPLPYKTVMENIKYPDTNSPIYDIGDETHNSNLFNKQDKNIHYSDDQIMKDLKHFNNASNILLEHYLNNNVPDNVTTRVQDYDNAAGFISETTSNVSPSYLYDASLNISKTKTYLYRLSDDKNQIKVKDGICLDASQRNTRGGKVHMWNCDANNKNQQWSYNPSTKQIKVTDGLCLDASQRNRSGGKVHMWKCNIHNKNQQWDYDPSTMQIKAKHGICLDASENNTAGGKVHMWDCDVNKKNQQWVISGDPSANNGLYLFSETTEVDGVQEEDNIYNYTYDLSGLYYNEIYDELTKYENSSFNNTIPMTKPGKHSSYFFESNYADLSDSVTKDFKHFYSTSNALAGHNLFNKS